MSSTLETLTVDGTELTTYAFNITSRSSRWRVPQRVGENVEVAGRDGRIWTPGKRYDQNTLVLGMWAIGANAADGTIPTSPTQKAKLFTNIEALVKLFSPNYRLLVLTQTLADGTTRECSGEVVSMVDFTSQAGGTRAEFAVEIVVPDGTWRDVSDQTFTSATNLASGTSFAVTQFEGATALMQDLVYRIYGPTTTFAKLTNLLDSSYVNFAASIANGSYLEIDSSAWTVKMQTANTNQLSSITHSGSPRLLVLHPALSAAQNLLRLDHGGGNTSATKVVVVGRRRYQLA